MGKSIFGRLSRIISSKSSTETPQKEKPTAQAPVAYQLKRDYTIVSAVYNTAEYLDEYFTSIFAQSAETSKLHLILVDDGSTDNSRAVIERWQQEYPGQIVYLHQENAGPGAARNLGLAHVQTEWVTFIDSDDKISDRYFEYVDKAIAKRPDLVLATCHVCYWRTRTDTIDENALSMRHFKGKDQFFAVGDDHMHPIYFINATFFKTEEIRAHNLEIDSKLRPNFEDGKFIAEYLLNAPGGLVGYLAKPKYYYRKRADGTSVIDNSFESAEKYTTVLSRGYLAVLREAQEKRGYVPSNLQQTVIRDLSWYFKRLINRQERCEQLEHDGVREFFLDALDDIFSHISISELFATNSSFLHFKVKLGIAQTFMKEAPPFWMCKIVKVDLERRELLIETYTDRMQFFFDGYPATPKEVKRATSTFCDLDFCSQYRVWLSIPEDASIFSFRVPDGTLTKLLAGKKMYERNLTLKDLARYLDKYWADYQQVGDTWLIMDRDNQADDNGEHFYRFMAEHHPEQDILFALESTSPDWERLEREGFNLVDFGTSEFEEALRSCTKIISSHANHYLLSYFGDDYIRSKKFVFLQHGIVSNDLSRWLNTFDPDLMLTTTPDERASIVSADSPYVYTEKQVKLTGLPRHDTLIKKRFEHQASGKRSTILIMPTWRRYLVDLEKDRQNGGPSNPEFPSSEYAQTWQSLLNSPELKELADTFGLKIVFFPHAIILPYVANGGIAIPPYVELGSCDQKSIQDYISEASAYITDYTSASFDASMANIPVVYYQFDRDQFYGGAHSVQQGYFDYRRDGFGPVVATENECINELKKVADRNFTVEPKYASLISRTFPMADGHCCERVYEEISKL